MTLGKEIDRFYGGLPAAIGVYTDDLEAVYVNRAFLELCRLGAYEFGSAEAARREIEASFVQHRNKRAGVVRLAQPGGASRVFHVSMTPLKVAGRRYRVYAFWGPPGPSTSFVDPERQVFIFGELRVNVASRAAFYKRRLVALTDREFGLLAYFAAHEDRLLTKTELLKEVWGQRATGTRTLDVYVSRLKAKLRRAGLKSERIRTQHGQGYIWLSEP